MAIMLEQPDGMTWEEWEVYLLNLGRRRRRRRGVLGSAGGPVPDAPVLTWTSGVTDSTPNFSVNLPDGLGAPHDAVDGDVIYLEIADNISFTTTSTDTLDAGDIAGDPVAMEQTTPLADGTYYARARIKRGASFGAYSNVESKTLATATANNRISSTSDRRISAAGDYRIAAA